MDKAKLDSLELKTKMEARKQVSDACNAQRQELDALNDRVAALEKEKAELLKSCEEEEKNKQEMIVSLLDSISKYKETMDVSAIYHGFEKSCRSILPERNAAFSYLLRE